MRKAFLRSFIKRLEINKDKATIYYHLPLPYNENRKVAAEALPIVTPGGTKVTRQLLFPLLFLALAIPLPFTHQLAGFLAKIVATGSVALAGAVGLTVVREGTLVIVGGWGRAFNNIPS